MFKNEYTIPVDIKKKMKAVVPTFVQYDSATLIFKIFNDGKSFDLTGFTKAEVAHKRRDGQVIIGEGVLETLANNEKVIRYTYMGNEMDKEGYVETSLSIFSDNEKVSIQPFKVEIIADNRDGSVDPANPQYGLLQELIVNIENVTDNAIEQAARAQEKADELKFVDDYKPTINYKQNNMVSYNGSTFIAIKDNIGNTPIGDASDVNWRVAARKGNDGTGTLIRYQDVFTSTANQTVFTLSHSYDRNLNKIDVIVGGVPQYSPSNFTESSSTTITLSSGIPAGIPVIITYFSQT